MAEASKEHGRTPGEISSIAYLETQRGKITDREVDNWFNALDPATKEEIGELLVTKKQLEQAGDAGKIIFEKGDLSEEVLFRYLYALGQKKKLDVFTEVYDDIFDPQKAKEKIRDAPLTKKEFMSTVMTVLNAKSRDKPGAIVALSLAAISLKDACEHYEIPVPEILGTLFENPASVDSINIQELNTQLNQVYRALAEAEKGLELRIGKRPVPGPLVVYVCIQKEHEGKSENDLRRAVAKDFGRIAVAGTSVYFGGSSPEAKAWEKDRDFVKALIQELKQLKHPLEFLRRTSGSAILHHFHFLKGIGPETSETDLKKHLERVPTPIIAKLIGVLRHERDHLREYERGKIGKFVRHLEDIVAERITEKMLEEKKEPYLKATDIIIEEFYDPLQQVDTELKKVQEELKRYRIPKAEGEHEKPKESKYETIRKIIGFIADLVSLIPGVHLGRKNEKPEGKSH